MATRYKIIHTGKKATGAEIDTGTDDEKYVTPKAIADSGLGAGAVVYKNGVSSRAGNTASGDQTIAHGLGAVPNKVKITAHWVDSSNVHCMSVGVFDGTTMSLVYTDFKEFLATTDTSYVLAVGYYSGSFYQLASIAVDVTNITLSWTKVGTCPATNIKFMWEVE
jgi:hypothetical protein